MTDFYMSMICDECGEDIFIGPIRTLLEHDGLPEIPYDMAAQQRFTCECGTTYVTGDFDYMNRDDL